jgi:hypothetical protein
MKSTDWAWRGSGERIRRSAAKIAARFVYLIGMGILRGGSRNVDAIPAGLDREKKLEA